MKNYQFISLLAIAAALFLERLSSYSGISGVLMTRTSMDPLPLTLGLVGILIGAAGFGIEKLTKEK